MNLRKSLKTSLTSIAGASIIVATSYGMFAEGMFTEDINPNKPTTERSLENLVMSPSYHYQNHLNQLDLESQTRPNSIQETNLENHDEELDYLRRFPDSDPINMARHTVNNGESLYLIASQYLDSSLPSEIYPFIDAIIEHNQKTNDIIHYGETLIIPINSERQTDNSYYSMLNLDEKIEFLRDRSLPTAEPYIEDIITISEEIGIDARLPMAIASNESEFNPNARSHVGALGIWQLMPNHHRVSDNEIENLVTAMNFTRNMYDRFLELHQNEERALISTLAGYNAGPNRIMNLIREGLWDGYTPNEIPINETRNYLRKNIIKLRDYGVDI